MNKPVAEIELGHRANGLSEGARAVARGLRRPSLVPGKVVATACLLDGAALTLGLWFSRYLSAEPGFDPARAGLVSVTGALVVVLVAWVLGQYRLRALRRRWQGTALLLGLGLLLALASNAHVSAVIAIALLVVPARTLGSALAAAAIDFGLTERRAVIIGGGAHGAEVMAALAKAPDNDIRICGIFDDRDDSRSPPVLVGVPKLGTIGLAGRVRARR